MQVAIDPPIKKSVTTTIDTPSPSFSPSVITYTDGTTPIPSSNSYITVDNTSNYSEPNNNKLINLEWLENEIFLDEFVPPTASNIQLEDIDKIISKPCGSTSNTQLRDTDLQFSLAMVPQQTQNQEIISLPQQVTELKSLVSSLASNLKNLQQTISSPPPTHIKQLFVDRYCMMAVWDGMTGLLIDFNQEFAKNFLPKHYTEGPIYFLPGDKEHSHQRAIADSVLKGKDYAEHRLKFIPNKNQTKLINMYLSKMAMRDSILMMNLYEC